MNSKSDSDGNAKLEHAWPPIAECDDETPEVPSELTLDADDHTPEEAGYGHGV